MSQENVELAKRFSALARRGEVDAVLELVADDVVVTNLAGPLDEPQVFHGVEAALAHWAEHTEVLDDFSRDVDEWVDAGDWVISVGRWKGRGKASGAEVEGHGANASRFQDGKLVEWVGNFPTKSEALKAVGLSELAMPEENVEVVRAGVEAFSRGDLDGMLGSVDPEIEIHPDPAGPLGGQVWRGREGILIFLEDWLEPWDEFRLEPSEFIGVGDQVVLLADQFGRRRESAVEVKMAVAHVYKLRGGSIVRLTTYIDQTRALEAVGLSE